MLLLFCRWPPSFASYRSESLCWEHKGMCVRKVKTPNEMKLNDFIKKSSFLAVNCRWRKIAAVSILGLRLSQSGEQSIPQGWVLTSTAPRLWATLLWNITCVVLLPSFARFVRHNVNHAVLCDRLLWCYGSAGCHQQTTLMVKQFILWDGWCENRQRPVQEEPWSTSWCAVKSTICDQKCCCFNFNLCQVFLHRFGAQTGRVLWPTLNDSHFASVPIFYLFYAWKNNNKKLLTLAWCYDQLGLQASVFQSQTVFLNLYRNRLGFLGFFLSAYWWVGLHMYVLSPDSAWWLPLQSLLLCQIFGEREYTGFSWLMHVAPSSQTCLTALRTGHIWSLNPG